jgi:hypothetical protein
LKHVESCFELMDGFREGDALKCLALKVKTREY